MLPSFILVTHPLIQLGLVDCLVYSDFIKWMFVVFVSEDLNGLEQENHICDANLMWVLFLVLAFNLESPLCIVD